jgi:hypothetical protein
VKADVTYIDAIEQDVTDIVGYLDGVHREQTEYDLRLLESLAELHQQAPEEVEERAIHVVLGRCRMSDVFAMRPAIQRVCIFLRGLRILHEQFPENS